jgi:hypothetical protein
MPRDYLVKFLLRFILAIIMVLIFPLCLQIDLKIVQNSMSCYNVSHNTLCIQLNLPFLWRLRLH